MIISNGPLIYWTALLHEIYSLLQSLRVDCCSTFPPSFDNLSESLLRLRFRINLITMRLLHFNNIGRLVRTESCSGNILHYAVLSHRWGNNQVEVGDLTGGGYKNMTEMTLLNGGQLHRSRQQNIRS